MSKRFREAFISSTKPSKRQRVDDEETRPEEEQQEPGALGRFLTNKKMIELLESKGIKALFPIQYRTFDAIFAGKDVKAKDKTGSGKTLAFSLPVIERFRKEGTFCKRNPKFLIMLPTRELVIQVAASIEGLKLTGNEFNVLGVYGGDSIKMQTSKLEKGVDIVVATPGRLIDMINRGHAKLSEVQVLCLDEADQMLRQGFQQDIETIFKEIKSKSQQHTQTLLFSATFPEWVDSLSAKYQSKDTEMVDLVPKEAEMPSTITHYLLSSKEDSAKLVRKLINRFTSKNGKTIVFCETKRQVNELYDRLGNDCGMLHGDVKQCDREKIYRDFKMGILTVIVATNVAARGLDFPNIELVVQTEPPREVESFIHRAGRTGRAGKSGVNVLIHSQRERGALEKIKSLNKFNFKQLSVEELQSNRR